MSNETAFEVFKLSAAGYCCTQIMLKMALEQENKSNEDLIISAKGLCKGIGGMRKTCGVLTGGIMMLGLYAGKDREGFSVKENYDIMISDFIDWFTEEFGTCDCGDIIGFQDENPDMHKCGDIIVKSYEKIIEILINNGYEFGARDD